jgi:hypothetical protein
VVKIYFKEFQVASIGTDLACLPQIPSIGIGVAVITIVAGVTISIRVGISVAISMRIAISIGIRITISITIIGISISLSLGFSISRPLANALHRAVGVRGAIRVASYTRQVAIGIRMAIVAIGIAIVAIQSRGISLGISISGPLATATEAGGREAKSRDSGPVRVGVVEDGVGRVVGTIEVAGVSLSIRGSVAPSQQDTQNLNKLNIIQMITYPRQHIS